MEWKVVQAGLKAAKKAGVRPPEPMPDWVYAYTASMRKRLEGRGITLIGHAKSMVSGRNNFQCSNGHVWRTIPDDAGRKVKAALSVGWAKEPQNKFGKLQNRAYYVPTSPGLLKSG